MSTLGNELGRPGPRSRLNAEYHAVDGEEPVIYHRVKPEGDWNPAVLRAVLYERIRREQTRDGSWLTATEMVCELPVQELGAVLPEEGDVLERGDGEKWRVLEVRRIAFDTVYQLPLVKER